MCAGKSAGVVFRTLAMAAAEAAGLEEVRFATLTNVSVAADEPVEGDINVPVSHNREDDFSTLDEPVKDTIMRDMKAVGKKFVHVLYPKKSSELLRDWDLWGPLILCVLLAAMLQAKTPTDRASQGPQFAEVFVLVWVGAIVVTLNSQLLGGNISFFQSLCVLGYCVMPLTVSMIVCLITTLATKTLVLTIINFIVVFLSFGWSVFASTAFLADSQPPNRKALAVYPIFLFYFVISWIILSGVHS
ncbi:protein YIPF6 isoform X1 [Lethenteron reissneri]|uniref:protein YIPF6 isoform X1 n=1 Tax=Lethenteron reissneri TaxID=7753 RepID=UPI002AB6B03E|nr:protein YIPF6 isoform X1 [Lethenteron reissneri]